MAARPQGGVGDRYVRIYLSVLIVGGGRWLLLGESVEGQDSLAFVLSYPGSGSGGRSAYSLSLTGGYVCAMVRLE